MTFLHRFSHSWSRWICHGEKTDPAVGAKLKTLYPQDQATGYKQGDVRGAFTITQPM